MDVIIIVIVLVALALAAPRWGVKSTDGIHSPEWERRQRWYGFGYQGGCMTTHPLTLHEHTLFQGSTACSRRSAFETAAGSLILHSCCPPSLVTSLQADRGLQAFTHVAEREHQLLLGIAERTIGALTNASQLNCNVSKWSCLGKSCSLLWYILAVLPEKGMRDKSSE